MSAPGPLVLLIEDEAEIRRFLRATLGAQGYRLIEAITGEEGIALAASHRPELVILDLGLPDIDGISVAKRLREWSPVPIIVLSARGQEGDKIAALDAGADDYVTKPFGVGELTARLRVALRHARRGAEKDEPVFEVGALRVDQAHRRVTLDGREVRLTALEYRLLQTLVHHSGRVVTHRQLLKEVWGPASAEQTHYLRVYMHQLRNKLEPDPARPRYLRTEQGVGYRLADE